MQYLQGQLDHSADSCLEVVEKNTWRELQTRIAIVRLQIFSQDKKEKACHISGSGQVEAVSDDQKKVQELHIGKTISHDFANVITWIDLVVNILLTVVTKLDL